MSLSLNTKVMIGLLATKGAIIAAEEIRGLRKKNVKEYTGIDDAIVAADYGINAGLWFGAGMATLGKIQSEMSNK